MAGSPKGEADVIGDAICRFNPIYGQGMSSALRQASLLSELLGRSNHDLLSTLPHDFLTKADDIVAEPWAMSAVPDFVFRLCPVECDSGITPVPSLLLSHVE